MYKFCHKCGSKIAVGDVFCEICGEKQMAVPEENFVMDSQPISQPAQEAPKKKRNWIIGFCAGAGTILLVITLLIAAVTANYRPYKKTIDNLFRIYYYGEYEKIEQMAPKSYWETIEEQEITVEDIVNHYEEFRREFYLWEDLKEDYGEDVKVSYKIIYQTNLSDEHRERISEVLNEYYHVKRYEIGRMYKIVVALEYEGAEAKDFALDEFVVVKINGEWYVTGDYGGIIYYWTGNIY